MYTQVSRGNVFTCTSFRAAILKNLNGGKLYSCFVDFRKAFDFVIHPGLQVKLKN